MSKHYKTLIDVKVYSYFMLFCFTLGVDCITEHHKFEIVCLDTDVLATALVAIHNARCTPQPDSIENRFVMSLLVENICYSEFFYIKRVGIIQ